MKTRAALHAAIVAVVAEKDFADVTVRAITREAGIGYATFFRHYPDKESLLADVAEGVIAELVHRLAPMVLSGDGAAAMLSLALFVEDHRPLCRALLIGGGDEMRREVTRRAVALAAQAPSVSPAWLPRDLAVTHIVHAALTSLAWWLDEGRELPPQGIADILDRLALQPAGMRLR